MTSIGASKKGGVGDREQVAVAVIVSEGKILIAHRHPHAALPDLWEFPGGKIEPAETAEECAIRETSEELGIRIEIVHLLLRRPYDYADRRVDIRFFLARHVEGVPRAIGCQEWRWVLPQDLGSYPLPDANEPILEALRIGGWLDRSGPVRKEGKVLSNRELSPGVIELIFLPADPNGETFRAGQYLLVEIDGGSPRAYSIASPPSSRDIHLCIKRLPLGPVSNYLAALTPGDRFRYTGPHGAFMVRKELRLCPIFIATGTGVAPLRSMILDLLEGGAARGCDLLFGAPDEDELIYFEEFRRLESAFAGFRYHPCVTRPRGDGAGGRWERGRVTDVLPRVLGDPRDREAYLCGGGAMIREALEVLARSGVARSRCHTEEWY